MFIRSRFLPLATALLAASSLAHANLLVNGDFEASTSQTATPPGWTNVGHSDGVISYGQFGTPAYDGQEMYDLGGFGDAYGPIGDGIAQSFATTAGATYVVQFGLSSENGSLDETLNVSAGNAAHDYLLSVDSSGPFEKPFATQTFTFVATGASTTLSFIHTLGGDGNNDPLIDGVSVTAVPEPASLALLLAGLGLVGVSRKRTSRVLAAK